MNGELSALLTQWLGCWVSDLENPGDLEEIKESIFGWHEACWDLAEWLREHSAWE